MENISITGPFPGPFSRNSSRCPSRCHTDNPANGSERQEFDELVDWMNNAVFMQVMFNEEMEDQKSDVGEEEAQGKTTESGDMQGARSTEDIGQEHDSRCVNHVQEYESHTEQNDDVDNKQDFMQRPDSTKNKRARTTAYERRGAKTKNQGCHSAPGPDHTLQRKRAFHRVEGLENRREEEGRQEAEELSQDESRRRKRVFKTRSAPERLFWRQTDLRYEPTVEEVESMMEECSFMLGTAERKREMNRLAALRSRQLRKERMRKDKLVIAQLQQDMKTLCGMYQPILNNMHKLSTQIAPIIRNTAPRMLQQTIHVENTMEALGDAVVNINNKIVELFNSENMKYATKDTGNVM